MFLRVLASVLSVSGALVWAGFGVSMVMWGVAAEATYALQESAPQQAAAAAYAASGSIIGYAVARAVTSVLRIVAEEVRAWAPPAAVTPVDPIDEAV